MVPHALVECNIRSSTARSRNHFNGKRLIPKVVLDLVVTHGSSSNDALRLEFFDTGCGL